jgi:transposase
MNAIFYVLRTGTKIHAIVDSKGWLLNFTVTGGQVHDSQVVEDVPNTPRPPLAVTGDKGYDSEKTRQQITDDGALPVIPSRSNATKKGRLSQRHKIENFFCRIKHWLLSPCATTSSPAIYLLLRSSARSTGSRCESRP